jgi:tetratricopeptide (TPR) repeat protein
LTDSLGDPKKIGRPNYDITAKYIHNFFKTFLNKDEISAAFINRIPEENNISPDILTTTFKPAAKLPPTQDQFIAIIRQQGGARAAEIYYEFNATDPGSITFSEATINILGYRALQSGGIDDAIALFKLNAETYPGSANCWDSYADGLQALGDNESALECYRKVLEVLPNDTVAGEGLRQTLLQNAEAGIERLEN